MQKLFIDLFNDDLLASEVYLVELKKDNCGGYQITTKQKLHRAVMVKPDQKRTDYTELKTTSITYYLYTDQGIELSDTQALEYNGQYYDITGSYYYNNGGYHRYDLDGANLQVYVR